jgi:hypothetical protein
MTKAEIAATQLEHATKTAEQDRQKFKQKPYGAYRSGLIYAEEFLRSPHITPSWGCNCLYCMCKRTARDFLRPNT